MRPPLLDLLACPECAGALKDTGDDLSCEACARRFPVRGGIPRVLPDELRGDVQATARAFGWQWRHFVEMHDQYESQFLDWVHPLGSEDFRDKVVLDGGCGIGRHSFFAAAYGARAVVALDVSDAVDTAAVVLADSDNAHVVQGDVLNPPFRRNGHEAFDIAYSIGVLHHLPDPEAGFRSLARLVRPGGMVVAWVYGYENNGFVRRVIDPLRRHVTTRVPPAWLRMISLPAAVVFHAVAKGVYGPLRHRPRVLRRLPLGEYLASVASFSFRQNHNIVFDQLVAPTAHYLRRGEFEGWFVRAGLVDVEISSRNGNSWRGRGRRP